MLRYTIQTLIIFICLLLAGCSLFQSTQTLTCPSNMKPVKTANYSQLTDGLIIQSFDVPRFSVNNYIIASKKTGEAALIDSGGYDLETISKFLTDNNLTLKYLLLTHGHYDHVAGSGLLQKELNTPVYMNYEDIMWLRSLNSYHMASKINKSFVPKDLQNLQDGDELTLGDIKIKILHTPGHSKGSVCFYIPEKNILFSGDTMFQGAYGRTDVPGGSEETIINSLKRLLTLPDNIIVFPGHGPTTTIKDEKQTYDF